MPNHSVVRQRSWLFTPGTQPDRLLSAAKSHTDISIFDLEDSVSPADKRTARNNLRALLNAPADESFPAFAVRINSTATRFGLDDLATLLDSSRMPQFILLPKIESEEQVVQIAALLAEANRSAALVPLIESARGLSAVSAIAQAAPSVTALMFGAADFASDVRAQPEALALQVARVRIAAACAQAGISAIDAPCFAIHDVDLLKADLTFAVTNGFRGKAAIHPSHIESITRAFTPSGDRIAWAKRVLEANDQGAAVVDGRMVDEAIAREAREILAAA
ncbi:aldolase/citrate lyase family protein [Burkholderia sp. PAMC 26561]|uniref:aldolase/citrate lyase family protein n=1 Tax=Burkholderia sp. PAMC 26561 TaxID=1795043 RepID=UPI00076AFD1D|nr:aldolase/citrate lyase family protein [Burkholderia sp. PAMC 26561]AME27400.1 citrate lyase subunit beta [Burkholderia sp. PAMC 26561]AME28065.1 citrate lyase subunit beta [Burkholderia sp. PAMC 26561]